MSHTYEQISGTARIGSFTYAITRLEVTYAVNRIPVSRIHLATGLAVGTAFSFSTAGISTSSTLQIFLGRNTIGAGRKVFEGYVSNMYTRRSQGSVSVIVEGGGWPSDLTSAISLGEDRAARMASDFKLPFIANDPVGGGLGAVTLFQIGSGMSVAAAFHSTILAGLTRLLSPGGGVSLMDKNRALAALSRVTGNLVFRPAVPIASDPGLRRDIGNSLAASMLTGYSGSTPWDILLSLAAQYSYMLIPTVDKLFMVPSIRTVASDLIERTMGPEDIVLIDSRSAGTMPISSVVVRGGVQDPVAAMDSVMRNAYLGSFVAPSRTGRAVVEQSPSWLTQLVRSDPGQTTLNITDGLTGRGVYGSSPTGTLNRTADLRAGARKSIADRYAQSRFFERVNSGNTATLLGPLQYDIVPGMSVQVRTPEAAGLAPLEVDAPAFVDSVTLFADSQSHEAGTRLGLTHMASSSSDELLPGGHPLYEEIATRGDVVGDIVGFS